MHDVANAAYGTIACESIPAVDTITSHIYTLPVSSQIDYFLPAIASVYKFLAFHRNLTFSYCIDPTIIPRCSQVKYKSVENIGLECHPRVITYHHQSIRVPLPIAI